MPWDRKRLLGYVETIPLILAVTDKHRLRTFIETTPYCHTYTNFICQ